MKIIAAKHSQCSYNISSFFSDDIGLEIAFTCRYLRHHNNVQSAALQRSILHDMVVKNSGKTGFNCSSSNFVGGCFCLLVRVDRTIHFDSDMIMI